MGIFGEAEARYYCSKFNHTLGAPAGSLDAYANSVLKGIHSLKENTPDFDDYRDCALRETERCLFLSISYYRRALDMMIPGASSWAHVTLYYSAFFAARALLGTFGGWISNSTKIVVQVGASTPGAQELLVTRNYPTTYRGSHERFWDIFYTIIVPLDPWLEPQFRFALSPMSGNVGWQTHNRNDINYDSLLACQLGSNFQTSFKAKNFPASLPGALSTQFSITDALLAIATKYAADFNLATDALHAFRPKGPRSAKLKRLVFRVRPPSLGQQAKWKSLQI